MKISIFNKTFFILIISFSFVFFGFINFQYMVISTTFRYIYRRKHQQR